MDVRLRSLFSQCLLQTFTRGGGFLLHKDRCKSISTDTRHKGPERVGNSSCIRCLRVFRETPAVHAFIRNSSDLEYFSSRGTPADPLEIPRVCAGTIVPVARMFFA